MPTLCPELCLHVCVVQANVLICGVVVLDVRWVVPNMVHSNMKVRCFTELPTFLYIISVHVLCQKHSIVFHT